VAVTVLDLKLAPSPDAVPDARRALRVLDDHVSPQTMDDLRLLVSELVTNSVRHAGLRESQTIELTVSISTDVVRVEVRDEGAGFEPEPRERDRTDPSGWGLYLVGRLADRWGVDNDGVTTVWFELQRHRPR
jgi:anti-sigma regulatory factor (Ser/Thr protein kinase)